MGAYNVMLTQEVTRKDALIIGEWLKNCEITKYLNEADDISSEINYIIDRVKLDILTHLFNRDGTFCMILANPGEPVGFVKLIHKKESAEMVIVIGDKNKWGKGIGAKSIEQILNKAFFQWRIPRVVAKIHPNNVRSVNAFEKSGFLYESDLTNYRLYSITMDRYIKRIIA